MFQHLRLQVYEMNYICKHLQQFEMYFQLRRSNTNTDSLYVMVYVKTLIQYTSDT